MREIKFRAWDIDCKIMRDWSWIRRCEFPFYSAEIGYDLLNEKYFNVMQYIGLKDKNGVDIYEGDIVEYWGGVAPVVYDKYGFAIKMREDDLFDFNNPDTTQVIGNIYENPELLKSNT